MTAISSDHLLEQAERLIRIADAGPPRQVDLRRAVSAAYYAVFHSIVTAATDHYVGKTKRRDSQYGLVYRSVDHRWLRELCEQAQKTTPAAKYRPHVPANGFGPNVAAFAAAASDLQDRRNAADYDPMIKISTADAALAIRTARSALRRFARASSARRRAFLSLLLFQPR